MKDVIFHTEADAEVTEVAMYYEKKSEGLGFSFLMELNRCLEQIIANPKSCQHVSKEIRRKPFKRFPYSLLYAIAPDRIQVVAVAHQKRRPNYWHGRLSP